MPARDACHDLVKTALQRDGWRITHDPLTVSYGVHNLFVDLGAEQVVAAEREGIRIAVEIKGFAGSSEVAELQQALGQFLMYRSLLRRIEPERRMVLAMPLENWESVMNTDLGRTMIEDYRLEVLVFDPEKEVIDRWFP